MRRNSSLSVNHRAQPLTVQMSKLRPKSSEDWLMITEQDEADLGLELRSLCPVDAL